MVNGQLDLTNEIFYADKLLDGPGMSLDAQDLHIRDFGRDTFNEVAHESNDASLPIFLEGKRRMRTRVKRNVRAQTI